MARAANAAFSWRTYGAGFVAGLVVAAAAALLLAPRCARAEEPVPDLAARQRAEWMVRMYVRTRVCMRSAGTAAFRRLPDAGAAHAQLFMVSVCGDPLRVQLQADGMPEWQARCTLARLARTSYYEDVVGIQEPEIKLGDAVTCDPTRKEQ